MEAHESQGQDFAEEEWPILDFPLFENELISGLSIPESQKHVGIKNNDSNLHQL